MDDYTDELIDGTWILVFGPMWLALAVSAAASVRVAVSCGQSAACQ